MNTTMRQWLARTVLPTLAALCAAALPLSAADGCPDAWITTKITARFMGHTGWSLFRINVDTEECVVTLSGCVNTDAHRAHAIEQAGKVKKVSEVIDHLVLCPADGGGSAVDPEGPDDEDGGPRGLDSCADAMITAEVKSRLLANQGLKGLEIDVDTEQCRVTLEGCVESKRQERKAVKLASRADGVRAVQSSLTICTAG